MKKEFLDFINSKEVQAPETVQASIYKKLEKDFIPLKTFSVVSKFLFLNFSAGVLTLAICPQFGLGLLSDGGHDVTHYFMGIGAWACALFCATVYFTIAQTLSLLILSNREVRWIAHKRFSVLPAIVISSYIALAMLGNMISGTDHTMAFEMEFQVIWVLAGLIITQAVFNLVSFKFKKISKVALK